MNIQTDFPASLPRAFQRTILVVVCAFTIVMSGCDNAEPKTVDIQQESVNQKQEPVDQIATPKANTQDDGEGKHPKGTSAKDQTNGKTDKDSSQKNDEPKYKFGEWTKLFDGKSTDGWEAIEFGGEGDFYVTDDKVLAIDAGDPLTGFSSTKDDLPKLNFEVELEARKTQGIDFFCGLTFPVEESHCTLVVGGWAGSTVGISCIDDLDASSNNTTKIMKFETDQWYKIRVRVIPNRLMVWIDNNIVIDEDITGKRISLRGDTTLCRPLGVCSFMTDAEIRNFQMRTLEAVEK